MPEKINLVMELIKHARVTNADVWINLDGCFVVSTPITRDEYASHVMGETIIMGDGSEPDAHWMYLKDAKTPDTEIDYLIFDTWKVSAVGLIRHQGA